MWGLVLADDLSWDLTRTPPRGLSVWLGLPPSMAASGESALSPGGSALGGASLAWHACPSLHTRWAAAVSSPPRFRGRDGGGEVTLERVCGEGALPASVLDEAVCYILGHTQAPWDRHGIIDWLSVPPSIAASGELCCSPFHSRPPIPMIECFKGAGFRNLLYSSKNCQRKH